LTCDIIKQKHNAVISSLLCTSLQVGIHNTFRGV